MKALSIHQPWASMIAGGVKTYAQILLYLAFWLLSAYGLIRWQRLGGPA